MSTFDELQLLSDGEFHQLGDELLRRLEPRLRRLRTHGLNDRGESIKGQPDSYVGESADSCQIAVYYTVQRARWWRKVLDDVCDAVDVSPELKEVIEVVPRNVDRDGPATGKYVTRCSCLCAGVKCRPPLLDRTIE